MNLPINYTNVFMQLEAFEKGLNVVGYLPYVRVYGGQVREICAGIQFVAGLAFSALALVTYFQGKTNPVYKVVGLAMLGHSILNNIRAKVEQNDGSTLFSTLPYDLLTTWYFGKRYFSYV